MLDKALFLADAVVLVGASYAAWRLLGLKGIVPLAVLQITAGLFLGPSVFGAIAPDWQAALFPPDVVAKIGSVATLSVVLYTFVTGMHLNIAELRGMRGLGWVAAGSFAVPFVLGCGLGIVLAALQPEELGTNHNIAQFALAFGLMITVTALPVLAALLKEMGYLHTPLGQTALGLAAINDAGLWAGLTVLLLFMALGGAMVTALLMPAYLAGVVVVRWLLARLAARVTLRGDAVLIGGVCLAFGSAALAEFVGIGYVFGAFLAGYMIPDAWRSALIARLEWPATFILMPFFFMATGLRTKADLLATSTILLVLALVGTTLVGKMLGAGVPALLAGATWREAASLGALLQTKGLMEVLVATILLDHGVISAASFSALVLMAIICTAIAAPMLRLLAPDWQRIRVPATP